MKIGVFDSGIGGLSVLHYAIKNFPNNHYYYYADKKNVPYGEKTPQEVLHYTIDAVQFLIQKGAEIIVIACNTATAVSINELRNQFDVPIIGMEPAIKKAVDLHADNRILMCATPITTKSNKVKLLIDRFDQQHQVDCVALAKLVQFAENFEFDSDEVRTYLKDSFSLLELSNYSTLVLGCTHFNYFKKLFRELLNDSTQIIDGNSGVVNRLISVAYDKGLKDNDQLEIEYYYSKIRVDSDDELIKLRQYLKRLDEMLLIE